MNLLHIVFCSQIGGMLMLLAIVFDPGGWGVCECIHGSRLKAQMFFDSTFL